MAITDKNQCGYVWLSVYSLKSVFNLSCDYISAMQIGQAQSITDQPKLASAGIQISIHILAHFIHLYASTFSPVADLLAASPAKVVADLWHFKAEDMNFNFEQEKSADHDA